MRNEWTGGQYSLFRSMLGGYLLVHFLHLAPWAPELFSSSGMLPTPDLSPLARVFPSILIVCDGPVFVFGLALSAALAAVALAIGLGDRLASLWIWYVLACFFARNPLIQNPSLPYLGWMLLCHAACPTAPYGSLAAYGRPNPGGGWQLPPSLYRAAWIVLAASYSYSGYTKLASPSWVAGETVAAVLDNPLARDWFVRDLALAMPSVLLELTTWAILALELFFAPLCLASRTRKWAWLGMLIVQLGFALLLNFADLTFAMLLFHLLTFDAAWLKGKGLRGTIVFFDGGCALCHGWVRALVAEDRDGAVAFAPLSGATFDTLVGRSPERLDSMIVRTPDGRLLVADAAVLHLLAGLGGLWRVIGWLLQCAPASLRRCAYHAVGARRFRLFGVPSQTCPLLPEGSTQRMLA